MPEGPHPSFAHYLAMWNERDPDRVRGQLDQAVAADVLFVDPVDVTGAPTRDHRPGSGGTRVGARLGEVGYGPGEHTPGGTKMTIEVELLGTVSDRDAYSAVADEMCAVAASEPGTLRYEWHLGADGRSRNIDVYSDGDAFLAHFGLAQENGTLDKFMGCVEIDRVEVCGEVNPAAAEALAGFGANFYDHVASIPT